MTPKANNHEQHGAEFVRLFGPLLDALRALGGSGRPREVVDQIAEMLRLSPSRQEELLPSGQPRFPNQVAWARFYLSKEGLIDSSRRGVWSLTDLSRNKKLNDKEAREIFLKWVKIYAQERKQRAQVDTDSETEEAEETEEAAAEELRHRLELMEMIKGLSPAGFERFCQRLLREGGFTQVRITGRSGDGGIDGVGILQINPFVSFQVLFQCKRYDKSVTPSQVRDFRGAMEGRADKGIIITTGTYTAEAVKEARRDGAKPIELVDGERLLDMCEQLELGLKAVPTYQVVATFFDEFSDSSSRSGS